MSYLAQGGGICPALLVGLELFTGTDGDPQKKETEAGVLKALFDPTNVQSGVSLFDKGDGHYSKVRYDWKKRGTDTDGRNSTGQFSCDDTPDSIDRQEDEFEIDVTAPIKRTFSVDAGELRELCSEVTSLVDMPFIQANPSRRAGAINGAISKASGASISVIHEIVQDFLMQLNGIRLGLNDAVSDLLVAQVGSFVDGDSSKSFPLLKSTDDALNNKGFNALKREYVNAELMSNGSPIFVGFGKLFDAMQSKKIAIGNDLGLDLSKLADMRYYMDYSIGDKLGTADDFVMFAPGTAQLGTFNQNRGSYSGVHANVHKGLFPDIDMGINSKTGRYNLAYDVFIKEECDGTSADKFSITTTVAYDLFTQPLGAYQDGAYDRLSGTNGIFHGTVTAV